MKNENHYLWMIVFLLVCVSIVTCNKKGTGSESDPMELQLNPTHVSTYGGSDGAVDLDIQGGSNPFTYLWSTGDTTEDIINLPVGIYTVTVKDASNETIIDSIQITQPYKLVRITAPETWDFDPHWSPDGQAIVYTSRRDGINELYIIPAEGGVSRQITFQGAYHPCWSPDGSTIAFSSSAVGGNDDIWTVPAEGGNPTRITTNPNREEYLDWYYDGSRIIYDSDRNGNWDIWSVHLDDANPVPITHHPSIDCSPSCSPDGSMLVFLSDRSGRFDLYTIPSTGGVAIPITNGMGCFGYSDWSPDGTQVVFMSEQSGNPEIWIISLIDGSLTQLTTHRAREDYPNWSPDGAKIAFTSRRDGNGDIWILDLESKYK